MSSVNTTCFNNKLSDFVNYFNNSQDQVNNYFSRVSINDEFKDSGNIKTIHPDGPFYNVSPNLFAEYLMEKVFKITTEYDSNKVYDDFNSYVSIVGDGDYYELPSINTLLAGTLLSYQIETSSSSVDKFNFNVAILLEEVYDNSGEIINSINLELRQKEPLMNNITSCNGTVYNFKEGVKLSDFANYIEQGKGENAAPYGYINYHSLLPTNLSINNVNLNTYVENTNFIKNAGNIYKKIESGVFPDNTYTTYFTGYLIIGGFYNNTKIQNGDEEEYKNLNELENCKPYITIIRIVRNSELNIKYDIQNNIFKVIDSNSLLFGEITSDSLYMPSGKNIPYNSVLFKLLPISKSNLSNSGSCYILKKLTDDD